MGYRIAEHVDTDADNDVDGSDLCYYSAYDENWRMVATYRSTDSDPKERFVHQQAGAGGYGGSSYIDLVAFREKDANTAWTTASDGTLEERLYYCQNQHADVVALIAAAGSQREMDRYSPYGVPFGLPEGDANSDGVANGTDRTVIQGWINGSTYDVRGDVDLDGDVDATDKTIVTGLGVVTLGRGVLSAGAVGSRRGPGGYSRLSMAVNDLYDIRRRVLATELGRWIQREGQSHLEQGSLYAYANSNGVVWLDPTGLCSVMRPSLPGEVGTTETDGNANGSCGPDPCESACADWYIQNPGLGGITGCCAGLPKTCVWWDRFLLYYGTPADVGGSLAGAFALSACAQAHENVHATQAICKKKNYPPGGYNPDNKLDTPENERPGYMAEIDCIAPYGPQQPAGPACNKTCEDMKRKRKEDLCAQLKARGGSHASCN